MEESQDSIFIAIPTRNGVRGETMGIVTQLMIHLKNKDLCILPGNSDIRIARSDMTYAFLKSKCKKMLFIDDDLVFSPKTVDSLCKAGGDIVGATYRKRVPPHEYTYLSHDDGPVNPRKFKRRMVGENLFLDVAAIGCGLMMIDRRVVEYMYEKYQDSNLDYYMQDDQRRCLIFQAENWQYKGKGRAMGEDFSFCLRAGQLGFKTEIIVDAPTDHCGITGNMVEFFPELQADFPEREIIKMEGVL